MEKWANYKLRVREEMENALKEEHTPRQTAFSAALGTFVTVLPTLGIGILFFLLISKLFSSVNKLALFACVIVFNPVMKYPIYIISYSIGSIVTVSSAPEETLETALTSQALGATQTMLVGNLILACTLSILAYILVLKLAKKYEEADLEIGEEIADKMKEEKI